MVGLFAITLGAFVLGACAANPAGPPRQRDTVPIPPVDPLREIIADRNIRIGVGTAVGQLFHSAGDIGKTYDSVLAREFNVITPENDLKFGPLRPSRAEFRYSRAD
jgi:endo-1,4-beta-xylanase